MAALQCPIDTGAPVFMLFIVATVVLMLGYAWGARRSRRIVESALLALEDALDPVDRTYRNIGGLLGYHAVFEMPAGSTASSVEATVTVLPRHSLLYLPVSLLVGRRDCLAVTFSIREGAWGTTGAARLEPRRRGRGGGAAADPVLARLEQVLPRPLRLQMAATIPSVRRVVVCLTPHPCDIADNVRALHRWVEASWPARG